MLDQRTHVGLDEDGVDRTVLALLLNDESHRLWAVEEIERELGDAKETGDALARLAAVGLVHRFDGFAFAARAAVRAAQLGD